ncbi:DUF2339 domain-containing protein [Pontiellaceae bacterium B12227]|nr:DUF2339 domain-containing protein [Pontiellaceae bacterium B12227]
MEGLIVLLVLLFVGAPITLSIIAIVKVSSLRSDLDRLRREQMHRAFREARETAESKPQPGPVPVPQKTEPVASVPSKPAPAPRPVSLKQQPAGKAQTRKPKPGIEFLMGGRAAAFIGVAVLVVGIALLVGYAIQHSWIGPGARVLLGLASGLVLVGLGHWVGRLDEKYTLFSRVLVGGGSSLFYFIVFAAFAFYHLIGPVGAGIGLFVSAAAIFGLAMFYGAQSVAVLGVLGAFITPVLIGGKMDAGLFALVYIALINVPVILLGVRRKWQLLYNLSFICTILHVLIWMDRIGPGETGPGMLFAFIYFSEFVALALLKLKHEQKIFDRNTDFIRIVVSTLLLLGMIYWLLNEAGHDQWTGTAFLLIGLLHLGVAETGYKIGLRFTGEITCFVAGGLFALAMALPVQFDGEWVSLGWAIEGAVLAWFALRVRSRTLQAGAFLLGIIGIMKVLVFDIEAYAQPPNLFLNARFGVGLISAGLIAVQGKFSSRFAEPSEPDPITDMGLLAGAVGVVLFFFMDIFWTVGPENSMSWLLTSLILLAAGSLLLLFGPPRKSMLWLGCLLFMAMPLKLLLVDSFLALDCIEITPDPFSNRIIWLQLVMLAIHVAWLQPMIGKRHSAFLKDTPSLTWLMSISALVSGLGILSLEIGRLETDWADMGITILWAFSALALILFGMKKRTAPHRYFGLILIGLATLKVLIVDSSELEGLQRIFAFIGTGILLLVLAFAYQKASAFFQTLEEE